MPVETIITDEKRSEARKPVISHGTRSPEQPAFNILAFDSWTGGARHYQRLLEAFEEKGMELTLVHLGSWGVDPGRPAEEQIGSLRVKDISSYSRSGFRDVLDVENPQAVIFLSTDTFAHRAFIRYCRQRKVPTVYLFHGLRSIQARDSSSIYKINVLAQFKFVASRLFKALTKVWPTYAKALWSTGAALDEWIRFGRDIIVLSLGRYVQVSSDDSRTDVCCVYIDAEVNIAEEKYGFAKKDVFAVGNPDLLHFGLTSESIGSRLSSSWHDYRDIMYVDSAFIYSGWVFASPQDYLEHLIDTRKKLAMQGKNLVFKPHPDHFRNNFIAVLSEHGFDVCLNEDFVPRLKQCCACISEQSSVAIIPALMGMPLLLADFGKLSGQRFGDMIMEYPRARKLANVADLSEVLAAEETACEAKNTLRWIDENAGPFPAEEMPRRVANVVLDVIDANQKLSPGRN